MKKFNEYNVFGRSSEHLLCFMHFLVGPTRTKRKRLQGYNCQGPMHVTLMTEPAIMFLFFNIVTISVENVNSVTTQLLRAHSPCCPKKCVFS